MTGQVIRANDLMSMLETSGERLIIEFVPFVALRYPRLPKTRVRDIESISDMQARCFFVVRIEIRSSQSAHVRAEICECRDPFCCRVLFSPVPCWGIFI